VCRRRIRAKQDDVLRGGETVVQTTERCKSRSLPVFFNEEAERCPPSDT